MNFKIFMNYWKHEKVMKKSREIVATYSRQQLSDTIVETFSIYLNSFLFLTAVEFNIHETFTL